MKISFDHLADYKIHLTMLINFKLCNIVLLYCTSHQYSIKLLYLYMYYESISTLIYKAIWTKRVSERLIKTRFEFERINQ